MIDKVLALSGYVDASSYRKKVVLYLRSNKFATPTQIAYNTGIQVNHISKTLSELKDKKIIVCVNEDARKGRLYRLTDLGKDVDKIVEELNS